MTNPLSSTIQQRCVIFNDSLIQQPFNVTFTDLATSANIIYKLKIITSTSNGTLSTTTGLNLIANSLTNSISGIQYITLKYNSSTGFYNQNGNDTFTYSVVAIDSSTLVIFDFILIFIFICINFIYFLNLF